MEPGYISLHHKGCLKDRIKKALNWLRKCTLCPRLCKADRSNNEAGKCLIGRYAVVASYGPHFGEENPLVGQKGSGTIFFSGCNLGCIFCQNYDISHTNKGFAVSPSQLAEIMVELQSEGCHNINFVTPSHVIAQILESLPYAIEKGLSIPLVYNSSGYDRVSALRLLNGIVDIYMPDFKFWDPDLSKRWCYAGDYPERTRKAVLEMHRQVGDLVIKDGIAQRGLLLRHLVMPGCIDDTKRILDFVAKQVSVNTYINIMDQYHPAGDIYTREEKVSIDRCLETHLSVEEFSEALRCAYNLGFRRIDDRRSLWRWLFRKG